MSKCNLIASHNNCNSYNSHRSDLQNALYITKKSTYLATGIFYIANTAFASSSTISKCAPRQSHHGQNRHSIAILFFGGFKNVLFHYNSFYKTDSD